MHTSRVASLVKENRAVHDLSGMKLGSRRMQTRYRESVQAAEKRDVECEKKNTKKRRGEEEKKMLTVLSKVEGRARECVTSRKARRTASGKRNVMKGRSYHQIVGTPWPTIHQPNGTKDLYQQGKKKDTYIKTFQYLS